MKKPDKNKVKSLWTTILIILCSMGWWELCKWYFISVNNHGFWYYYSKPISRGLAAIALIVCIIYATIQTVRYIRSSKSHEEEKSNG